MKLDQKLHHYPTIQDLWRARFMLLLIVVGVVGARYYFGGWKNPVTDFAIWAPLAFGMAGLFSQIMWQTLFPNFTAREHTILSAAVLLASFLLVGLVIG